MSETLQYLHNSVEIFADILYVINYWTEKINITDALVEL